MASHLLLRQGKAFPITMLVTPADLKLFSNKLAWKVFTAFSVPTVPIDAARALGVHEQKVYYYLNRFRRARLVKKVREEQRHGTVASYYQITARCFGFHALEDGQEGVELSTPLYNKHLEPFIRNGRLNCRLVVGSPDPHGPWQARASDACCAIDFALFLGGYTNTISLPNYKLDTEIRERDLKGNLILIGGPHVNMITKELNEKLPIFIDTKEKNIVSSLSGKTYTDDEYGMVVLLQNPWDGGGRILLLAGKRFPGTRAAVIAMITKIDHVFSGNNYQRTTVARVIRGVDADGDGIIDSAELVE